MQNNNDAPADIFLKLVLKTNGVLTVAELEEHTHYETSTIRRHLNNLVEKEEIIKEKQSNAKGADLPSLYRVKTDLQDPINRFIRLSIKNRKVCTVDDIAADTNYDPVTIRYHLQDMLAAKIVMVKWQVDRSGSDRPSLYRLP